MSQNFEYGQSPIYVDVREFGAPDGSLWLELFPLVFAPVDREGNPLWDDIQILNPRLRDFKFITDETETAYTAPLDAFDRGIDLLLTSTDWLREEEFDFEGDWSAAKILGTLAVGRSHDPVGALWMDRLKWIDNNVDALTDNSPDSLRQVDRDRNRKILHEVNWLAVFLNSSFYHYYPRQFKISELVRYGINEWSIHFAKRFPEDSRGWEAFLTGQCENSILRDICEAHLLFEEWVDPNPHHFVANHLLLGPRESGDVSRREFRLNRLGLISSEKDFQIRGRVDGYGIDHVREYVFWTTDVQTFMPCSKQTVSRLADQFSDYLLEITDKPHEGQIGSFELVETFLLPFIREYPTMFSDDFVSRVEAIDGSENLPYGFDQKAQWVFDEIFFSDFKMVFNPTGLTHDVLRLTDPGWEGYGVYSANAVFAISELIRKLPKPPFRQWLSESSTVFDNGFSRIEEIGASAERVIEQFQFFDEVD